jgi:uncharacterized protein (TIGR00369 family)
MSSDWYDFLKKDYVRGFPSYCGITVDFVDDGVFHTRLNVQDRHRQQDGFVHAGVMSTMADHTAGYAAYSIVSNQYRILTIEFKINFFKPATGDVLLCRSTVINRGAQIITAESELFSRDGDFEKRVAKATVTLMAVAAKSLIKNV